VVGYEACVLVTEQPSLGIHGPGRDNCVGGSVCDGVRLEAEPKVKDHPSPAYLFLCGSVSEVVHALVASFLRKIGKDVSFLKERDVLKIKEIHSAITTNR
jgi:hypothetical protein